MYFDELRDVVVERMAELDNRVAATDGNASRGNELILTRMKSSYRRLHGLVRRENPARVAKLQSFTYTADAEYIDLSSVPSPSLKHADILGLYDMRDPTAPIPLDQVTDTEFDAWLATGRLSGRRVGQYGYFVDGTTRLFLLPTPSEAVTVRARYATAPDLSALTTSTWAATAPDELPDEHHELIGLETAISFLSETMDPPSSLIKERDSALQAFLEWASGDRMMGKRRIIEVE